MDIVVLFVLRQNPMKPSLASNPLCSPASWIPGPPALNFPSARIISVFACFCHSYFASHDICKVHHAVPDRISLLRLYGIPLIHLSIDGHFGLLPLFSHHE